MYEEKIEIIDSYISKCDEILKNRDELSAHNLDKEFVGVFRNEIPYITQGLLAFSAGANSGVTYLDDISIVKQKLKNYKADWRSKADDKEYDLKMAEANSTNITNSNTLNNNLSITLSQVYDAVNKDKSLSEEDSQKLKELLGQVEMVKAEKDKGKIWNKIKPILTFIADKGADALIAAGPYLIQALK